MVCAWLHLKWPTAQKQHFTCQRNLMPLLDRFFLGGLSFTEFNWIITPKQIKSAQISALPRGDPLLKLKCSLCIDKARQQQACEVNLINAARRWRASQAHVCFGRGSSGTGFVNVSSCMSVDVAAREGMKGWRWSRWMRGDQWKRITGTSNHHCTQNQSTHTDPEVPESE